MSSRNEGKVGLAVSARRDGPSQAKVGDRIALDLFPRRPAPKQARRPRSASPMRCGSFSLLASKRRLEQSFPGDRDGEFVWNNDNEV
jgi:hypothetical protein